MKLFFLFATLFVSFNVQARTAPSQYPAVDYSGYECKELAPRATMPGAAQLQVDIHLVLTCAISRNLKMGWIALEDVQTLPFHQLLEKINPRLISAKGKAGEILSQSLLNLEQVYNVELDHLFPIHQVFLYDDAFLVRARFGEIIASLSSEIMSQRYP